MVTCRPACTDSVHQSVRFASDKWTASSTTVSCPPELIIQATTQSSLRCGIVIAQVNVYVATDKRFLKSTNGHTVWFAKGTIDTTGLNQIPYQKGPLQGPFSGGAPEGRATEGPTFGTESIKPVLSNRNHSIPDKCRQAHNDQVALAQLVELPAHNRLVAGSSPASRTKATGNRFHYRQMVIPFGSKKERV